jgi:hypothetical protein
MPICALRHESAAVFQWRLSDASQWQDCLHADGDPPDGVCFARSWRAGGVRGGDDDDTRPASGTSEAPDDLSGELIGGADLGEGWDSAGGPQPAELIVGSAALDSPCPGGETVELSDDAMALASRGNASIELARVGNVDDLVYEVLHHDPSGELFEAFRDAWGSCVGETWEQGDDPVENVRLESLDVDDLGEDARAYRSEWGSGGEYDGTDLLALVHTSGVLALVVVRAEDTAGGADDVFEAALAAAVAKLEDDIWSPGMLSAEVAPGVDQPAEVAVVGPGDLTVHGNDGCQLHGSESSYVVSSPDDFSDELPANVEWLIEQVFDAHALSNLQVWDDRVDIEAFLKMDASGLEKLDRAATEQLAEDLRQRLGNRSICR